MLYFSDNQTKQKAYDRFYNQMAKSDKIQGMKLQALIQEESYNEAMIQQYAKMYASQLNKQHDYEYDQVSKKLKNKAPSIIKGENATQPNITSKQKPIDDQFLPKNKYKNLVNQTLKTGGSVSSNEDSESPKKKRSEIPQNLNENKNQSPFNPDLEEKAPIPQTVKKERSESNVSSISSASSNDQPNSKYYHNTEWSNQFADYVLNQPDEYEKMTDDVKKRLFDNDQKYKRYVNHVEDEVRRKVFKRTKDSYKTPTPEFVNRFKRDMKQRVEKDLNDFEEHRWSTESIDENYLTESIDENYLTETDIETAARNIVDDAINRFANNTKRIREMTPKGRTTNTSAAKRHRLMSELSLSPPEVIDLTHSNSDSEVDHDHDDDIDDNAQHEYDVKKEMINKIKRFVDDYSNDQSKGNGKKDLYNQIKDKFSRELDEYHSKYPDEKKYEFSKFPKPENSKKDQTRYLRHYKPTIKRWLTNYLNKVGPDVRPIPRSDLAI